MQRSISIYNFVNILIVDQRFCSLYNNQNYFSFSYNDQKPTGASNSREPDLSSLLNFLLCIVGQSKSTQEAILTSQGSRFDCQSIEIFKIGMGLKLVKPFEIQGFFLVVPIIQLSPDFIFERLDTFESRII